jgi:hypothetical protein
MPLHHQEAHARKIMVDEHPGLHLLWYYERIFIKPIPAYFYEPVVWEYLRQPGQDREQLLKACLGFMRSWSFLVQYEIDYDLACSKKLIPKKPDGSFPTYEEFCDFIGNFANLADELVNRRYTFGELRLTRVNRTALITGKRLAYFHIHPQWGSVLAHILAPVITVFAIFSVSLEAMQVQLNAQQIVSSSPGPAPGSSTSVWPAFVQMTLYFPVIVLSVIAALLGGTGLGFTFMAMKDAIRAKSVRHKKKTRQDWRAGEKSHGMVW